MKKNALCGGVFGAREIIQPTVVDLQSFLVWKDEAFALWKSQWAQLYAPDSVSSQLISKVHDTYWLVNIVDNDFVNSTLYSDLPDLLPI